MITLLIMMKNMYNTNGNANSKDDIDKGYYEIKIMIMKIITK